MWAFGVQTFIDLVTKPTPPGAKILLEMAVGDGNMEVPVYHGNPEGNDVEKLPLKQSFQPVW